MYHLNDPRLPQINHFSAQALAALPCFRGCLCFPFGLGVSFAPFGPGFLGFLFAVDS
jgi:hypothetical protein